MPTHTLLTVTHVNGKSFYKVWKDTKRQRILETYAETERRYARQMDEWAWGALARLAEIQDEALGLDLSNEGNRRALEDAREMGTILNTLTRISWSGRGRAKESSCCPMIFPRRRERRFGIPCAGTGIAREGSKAVFAGPLDLYCPVYSAKREAEIEKAKRDSDSKAAPNGASP